MSYILECQTTPHKRWWLSGVSARGDVAHLPSLQLEAERLIQNARDKNVSTFRVRIKESDSGRIVYAAVA